MERGREKWRWREGGRAARMEGREGGGGSEISQVTKKQREEQKGEAEVGIAPALERSCPVGQSGDSASQNPQLGLGRKPLL